MAMDLNSSAEDLSHEQLHHTLFLQTTTKTKTRIHQSAMNTVTETRCQFPLAVPPVKDREQPNQTVSPPPVKYVLLCMVLNNTLQYSIERVSSGLSPIELTSHLF